MLRSDLLGDDDSGLSVLALGELQDQVRLQEVLEGSQS